MTRATAIPIKRAERLTRVADLCAAIGSALHQHGLAPDRIFLAFRDLMTLQCGQCGCTVPGEELFVLTQPTEDNDVTTGVHRLRLGFCSNSECKSYECTLTFQPGDGVDWERCLHRADRSLRDIEATRTGRKKLWRRSLARPVMMTMAAVLLILLVRQLYYGGRIPLIREPEKFRVDTDPAGEAFPH